MASSSSSKSVPALVPRGIHEGKPPISIGRPVWIIGSRKGCHLHLVSSQISQAHAVIINTGRGLFIKDLASRSHTYVNKQKVTEALLREGDKVQVGSFKFRFTDPTATRGDKPPVAPQSLLRLSGETMPVFLENRITLIGRRSTADLPLAGESVSTTHALIVDLDGDHYVRDLGSRTGTFVNGEKVHQVPLAYGDVIKVGDTEFTYDDARGETAADDQTRTRTSTPVAVDESAFQPDALSLSSDSLLDEDKELAEALSLSPASKNQPASTQPELDLSMSEDAIADVLADEAHADVSTGLTFTDEPPAEISATASPVTEAVPLQVDDLSLDAVSLDTHDALHDADLDQEDTAFHVSHAVAPVDENDARVVNPIADSGPTDLLGQSPEVESAGAEVEDDLEMRRGWRRPAPLDAPAEPELPEPKLPELKSTEPKSTESKSTEPVADEPIALPDVPPLEELTLDDPTSPLSFIDEPATPDSIEPAGTPVDAETLALEALAEPTAPTASDAVSVNESIETTDIPAMSEAVEVPSPPADLSQIEPPLVDEVVVATETPVELPVELTVEPPAVEELPLSFETSAVQSAVGIDLSEVDLSAPAVEELNTISDVSLADEPEISSTQSLIADPDPQDIADDSELVQAPAESVFENVDIDALALDALSEPEPVSAEPIDLEIETLDEPAGAMFTLAPAESDVSATMDVTLPGSASLAAQPTFDPLPELEPLASTDGRSEPLLDLGASATPPVESMDDIDLSSLSSTAESMSPPPTETAIEEPATPVDEKPRPLFVPSPRSRKKTALLETNELPPPLEAPIKVKPSTRRRKPPAKRGTKGAISETSAGESPVNEAAAGKSLPVAPVIAPSVDDVIASAESADVAGREDVSESPFAALRSSNDATPASAEVIESTEPTPESALNLDPAVEQTPGFDLPAEPAAETNALSDSVFGRAVESLSGSALGDLIEPTRPAEAERTKSPFEQIVSEASAMAESETAPEAAVEVVPHDEVTSGELELSDDDHILDLSDSSIHERPPTLALEHQAAEAPAENPAAEPGEVQAVSTPVSDIEEPALTFAGEPSSAEPHATISDEIELEPAPHTPADALEELADLLPPEEPWLDGPQVDGPQVDGPQLDGPQLEAAAVDDTAVDEMPIVDEPIAEDSVIDDLVPDEAAVPAPQAEAAPAAEATLEAEPVTPEAPAPIAPQHVAPPMAPFFGLTRDADTFLGGLPLQLQEIAPPPSSFGKVGVAFGVAPERGMQQAPPPPPLAIDDGPSAPATQAPSDTSRLQGDNTLVMRPRGKMPPRPQRNKLQDYENRFANVAEDQALQEMLRSQPPAKPAEAPPTSPFDGLAAGPAVRHADVFSQMPAGADAGAFSAPANEAGKSNDPFLVDKQSTIDLAARNVAVGHLPPGAGGLTNVAGASTLDPFNVNSIPTAGLANDPLAGAKARRSAAVAPSASPDFSYSAKRPKRRIGIRVLIGAMIVMMGLAGVLGYKLTPVKSTVQAKVTYTNLSQSSQFDQGKFKREQEAVLNGEIVRQQAIAALQTQSPGTHPGLLGDALAFDRMTHHPALWPENSNWMVLQWDSVDPEGDKKRLAALLSAFYSENKNLIDQAARKRSELDAFQAELDKQIARQKELGTQIRTIQESASDAPGASQIAELEQQAVQLSDAWKQLGDNVKALKIELERLAPGGETLDATPVVLVPGGDPQKDPFVQQWREDLKALQAKIDQAKSRGGDDSAELARKGLDDALAKFQDQLTAAQAAAGGNPALDAYVKAAEKLQSMTKQLTSELLARQKVQYERLTELKRGLEEQMQTKRDELYGKDPELQKLTDDLSLARRQANGAAASGLEAEAARFQAESVRLAGAVEARRTALGQDPVLRKFHDEVQLMITASARSMEDDRKLLDVQMSDVQTVFSEASAGVQKLPAEQKALADALAARKDELLEARRAYLVLSQSGQPGDNGELAKLDNEAKLISAKIDQRVNELNDAERKNRTELEKQALVRQIEQKRSELASVEKAEIEARTKWMDKQRELADVQSRARLAKGAEQDLQSKITERQKLEQDINARSKALDARRSTGTASVVPEPPTADAVAEIDKKDDRLKYAFICTMAVVGVFTFLILLGGYHHSTPAVPATHRAAIEPVASPTGKSDDEEAAPV